MPTLTSAADIHLPDVCRRNCEHVTPTEPVRIWSRPVQANPLEVGDFVIYVGPNHAARRSGLFEVVEIQPAAVVLDNPWGPITCGRASIRLAPADFLDSINAA